MQRLYIPGGILVSSALYVCSEALVIAVQGEEYRKAIDMLRILCWSVALTYGRIAADAALTAGDRMKVKIVLQVCAIGALLLLSLPMISYGGAQMGQLLEALWRSGAIVTHDDLCLFQEIVLFLRVARPFSSYGDHTIPGHPLYTFDAWTLLPRSYPFYSLFPWVWYLLFAAVLRIRR
jgi:hypothetical protein